MVFLCTLLVARAHREGEGHACYYVINDDVINIKSIDRYSVQNDSR